jgi:hypothetical protein
VSVSGGWEIWDHFQVRSAGFPADWLDGLVRPAGLDFATRVQQERQHLRAVFQNLRLQAAVVWQNPDLAANFLFPWLEREQLPPERSQSRRVERKLLAYLQRYCAKNEAIGTFGPIGWGSLCPQLSQPVEADGPWLVARTVYWEPWLFGELSKSWEQPPRLSPRLRLHNGMLYGEPRSRRRDGGVQLTPSQQRVLSCPEAAPSCAEDSQTLVACLQRGWLSRAAAVPASPRLEAWADGLPSPSGQRERRERSAQLAELARYRSRLAECAEQPRELLAASLALRESLRE